MVVKDFTLYCNFQGADGLQVIVSQADVQCSKASEAAAAAGGGLHHIMSPNHK